MSMVMVMRCWSVSTGGYHWDFVVSLHCILCVLPTNTYSSWAYASTRPHTVLTKTEQLKPFPPCIHYTEINAFYVPIQNIWTLPLSLYPNSVMYTSERRLVLVKVPHIDVWQEYVSRTNVKCNCREYAIEKRKQLEQSQLYGNIWVWSHLLLAIGLATIDVASGAGHKCIHILCRMPRLTKLPFTVGAQHLWCVCVCLFSKNRDFSSLMCSYVNALHTHTHTPKLTRANHLSIALIIMVFGHFLLAIFAYVQVENIPLRSTFIVIVTLCYIALEHRTAVYSNLGF